MKVVILIAGKGRRLGQITEKSHKALIKLDEYSLLYHLIENFIYAGLNDFVPIVGHCASEVLSCFNINHSDNISTSPVYNQRFNETNNLYSLYCARELLEGDEFILCNGDLILDREILVGLKELQNLSAIAIDDFTYNKPLDSPGILMNGNKISDLGRHIPFEKNTGYAIGVYKFNKKLSEEFFKESKKMLDNNINAGFHDPLSLLFDKFDVYKHQTKNFQWTDIDTFEDIEIARGLHKQIIKGY